MILVTSELSPLKPADYPKQCIQKLIDFNQPDHPDRKKMLLHTIAIFGVLLFNMARFSIFYLLPLSDMERFMLFDVTFVTKQPTTFNLVEIQLSFSIIYFYQMFYFRFNSHLRNIIYKIMFEKDVELFPNIQYGKYTAVDYVQMVLDSSLKIIQIFIVVFGNK